MSHCSQCGNDFKQIQDLQAKLAKRDKLIDEAVMVLEAMDSFGWFKPQPDSGACWGCDMGGARPIEFQNTHDPDCPFLMAHNVIAKIQEARRIK